VLNGADGVNQTLTGLVGQGLAIYDTLRHSLATPLAKVPAQAVPVEPAAAAPAEQ